MAKETKIIKVQKDDEEDIINEWQSFGWELGSNQEQDYSSVKLTFERDSAKKNYAELVSLEKQFNSLPNPRNIPTISMLGIIVIGVGGFIFLIGIICLFSKDFLDAGSFYFVRDCCMRLRDEVNFHKGKETE